MGFKKSTLTRHALSALRMALVWARKGGALKRSSKTDRSDRMYYGERQLSFDETPTFHLKMRRPPTSMRWISCVNPSTIDNFDEREEKDLFKWNREEDYICPDDCHVGDSDSDNDCELVCEDDEDLEQEIDSKADEFIANFYSKMQLQRQISLLQYNEMLERSCR